ncbi:MAG: aminotransferase class III-fold pyridoxal phosphate-dependent enzyme [Sutterella sp.]|nr:aminotransferase class III-fold pyridoxal phosphate-dependent enzyme [Sutterella sp.]MDD7427524.1 aminotransferase class III-fold pyridoxal phosphate-dependent enzyme [Sutterella sp.]MDY3273012.1 aminotransferase class III-fold pyridoxal phosphate-dependent enzyme [Duodenibacillus sp.]
MKLDRCNALVERDEKVVAPCQHLSYYPLAIAKVEGSVITDLDGNKFIDFLSSASSLNIGSSNPIITKAIEEQLKKFTQYTAAYTYNEQTTEYAERLVSVYPGGVKAKVCFGNCGSDGNDAAVKFARAFTGRQKIIVFINGYHGNTYGSCSMTTCSTRMHAKMGPFLPEIYPFPFYGTDKSDEEVERDCMKAMETAFSTYLPATEVAAMVIEPVQGDGGILPAHPIFMKKLYETCKKYGILFISEEVQQGFYRTGKFFAIEHYGIVPDGIIMGKSVGATLTLGAFMARDEIMDCLPAPAHLFTLGGNSIACAAGIAQFDYLQSEAFQTHLKSNIALLEKLAADLKAKHPKLVAFTRNLGFSMGIGIQKEDGSPDTDGVFKILFRSYEKGLVVISLAGWILRIQPPLTISPELLTRGFEIMDAAMNEYERGEISDDVLKFRAGW